MKIEQVTSTLLSIEINNMDAKPNPLPGTLVSSFVATIYGDTAKFKELRDPENCQANLRRVTEGVVLENHCGGADGGVYLKQE